ncbi:MAG: hypothetical protein AAF488_01425 [Planctomycetota bacterium]
MNEFWQADSFPSFCFCYDGEWFQTKADDTNATWDIYAVEVVDALPVEMTENYSSAVAIDDMLAATGWSTGDLEAKIAAQLDRVD